MTLGGVPGAEEEWSKAEEVGRGRGSAGMRPSGTPGGTGITPAPPLVAGVAAAAGGLDQGWWMGPVAAAAAAVPEGVRLVMKVVIS